jgi:hypothetical protein
MKQTIFVKLRNFRKASPLSPELSANENQTAFAVLEIFKKTRAV